MASTCTTINFLEDFLLNSGPKQDCLFHICEYINVYDMVNLSESSKHSELFMEFFKERVIGSISCDLTEIPPTTEEAEIFQKVFENFGSCMQKAKVDLSRISFEQFMQKIIQHGMPGNLTELEIETGYDCRVLSHNFKHIPGYGWLEQARPILHRLEKLILIDFADQMELLFELYKRDLPNLKLLTLKNFNFSEKSWTDIFPIELSIVTELRLIKVKLKESVSNFELFLNRFTNLQVFVHLRANDENPQPEVIADCLYRRFPQLRGIGCNTDDFSRQSTFPIGNRFSFLQRFTNLSELHVTHNAGALPCDVHNIIQFVPNIKILSIMEVETLFQPPVAVRRIKAVIKEVIDRRRFPPNDRIQVIVNERQYRDFMALKNVNEIIRLSLRMKSIGIPKQIDYYDCRNQYNEKMKCN